MKDEIEIKNISCLSLVFVLILTLFLPIANNETVSFSLLNFTCGKVSAVVLLGVYIIIPQEKQTTFSKV